jgi:hypothetical protein
VLFLLASIILRPRRFRGGEPERRLGGRRDLGHFLFRLLGFAVSALLTSCHRNPPLNEARGCEPGVPREGRVFRFCKQPLEVGENIRDERGPRQIFGGRRLRKQDQKITGLGHDFNPAGGRRGEKQVLKFVLALPQRGMVGVDRGELTAHPGRLSARPPLVDRPDRLCVPPKFAHFQRAVGRPGELKTQWTQPCIHKYAVPGAGAGQF